jgi:RNA polymerase sigma factor (sigma-70 family)
MHLMRERKKGTTPGRGPEAFAHCKPLIDHLFTQSGASFWDLSVEEFSAALARSAKKSLPSEPSAPALQEYLSSLHLQDLALSCACAEGRVAAWEHFVANYQPYLRTAAAAILRCPVTSPNACELADSLLADLYGLAEGKRADRSLFRYFHGRSSLKTWLRAVLARRHVDAFRASSRLTDLPEDQNGAAVQNRNSGDGVRASSAPDPHRERYLALFTRTIELALGLLDPLDLQRLRLYYSEQQTLADIGRQLNEHESSVSRNLERIRRQLRHDVEELLRKGRGAVNGLRGEAGLSDAEIALCFEYAAEEVPIDFAKLFPAGSEPKPKIANPKIGTKEPRP